MIFKKLYQTDLKETASSSKIVIQLFGWSLLISFILGVLGLSFAGVFGWFMLSPVIVGYFYAKKYQVKMPQGLRKYSAVYYTFFSSIIWLFMSAIFIFSLQAEKPIDNFIETILAVFVIFVIFFIAAGFSVYFFLDVDLPEKN